MAELKTNRLTDLSFGDTIDNAMGDLETDIAAILGLSTGVNYTAAAVVSVGLLGSASAGVYQGTAYGVATLNASSLVVQNPAKATTSGGVTAATGYLVQVATNWAYIHSSWGGTASSIATLNDSALVMQDPVNAVTAPGINKIVKADSATFSGGGFVDPTWVGASMTAGAYKVVRADSTGAISSGWAGSYFATLTSAGGLTSPIDIGGIGEVASPASGTVGLVCTVRTPVGTSCATGEILRMDTSDGKVRKAQANTASAATGMFVMSLQEILSDTEGSALLWGRTDLFAPGFATGSLLYLSSTVSGDVVSAAPTGTGSIVRLLGYDLGNGVFFDPDQTWIEL